MKTKSNKLTYSRKVAWAAFLCALSTMCAFLIRNHFMLPPDDQAKQMNISCAVLDPFVLTLALLVAMLAAVVIYPLAFLCLKERKVLNSGLFVSAISVISVVGFAITDHDVFSAIPRVLVISVVSLLLCRLLPLSFFREAKKR